MILKVLIASVCSRCAVGRRSVVGLFVEYVSMLGRIVGVQQRFSVGVLSSLVRSDLVRMS